MYLKDALLSVQQQSFGNFECICVNDGSVDNSEAIIDEFVAQDNRFIKINQENQGVSGARNTGLDAAKGDYVFLMDHDDLIPKNTLKNLHDAAVKYNADMSRGRMMMIRENFALNELHNGNSIGKFRYFDNPLTDFYKHIRGKYKSWVYIWQCLFKKSAIQNIRFVESLRSGGEDNLFMFEVISKINDFVQIDDIVACHRRSKTSITLNGFKSLLIDNYDIIVPYVYDEYATDSQVDKRLLWWVYRKVSYGTYRILIRDTIRSKNVDFYEHSRRQFLKFKGKPEFDKIYKRWSCRQKFFYSLFMSRKYKLLQKLSFIL